MCSRAGMEDRISQLADELLCHVLSFLPTRKSVQTAIVLSKQWYNVCESITTLNIDCRRDFGRTTLRNIDRFADFVDDAVSLLGWSKIQKLSLSCPGFCDHYRIIYHLPIPGCFSSLKSLSLSLVYQDSPDIENLITNCCPLLEDLDIRGDILLPHDTLLFKISAPKLQKLTLEIDLATEGRSSSVIINSPKLESITLKREHSQYSAYILEKTESLNRAVVDFAGRGKDVMTQLLAAFSGVKDLYIGAAFIKNCDLPAEFSKLNKLQLILHPNSYREYVTILLNKSPNLEYLVLELDNKYELQVPAFTPPQFVPVSLSLHLKKIHMRGFCNRRGELKVLYYLLQHSKALNVLVISSHPTLCHSEEEALYKSILGFPGVSKTFQVRFL